MSYQWDPNKAFANLRKHGIDFADAIEVLSDDSAITIEDLRFEEERFMTIDVDAFGRILVVVYTWRGDSIRLIADVQPIGLNVSNIWRDEDGRNL